MEEPVLCADRQSTNTENQDTEEAVVSLHGGLVLVPWRDILDVNGLFTLPLQAIMGDC